MLLHLVMLLSGRNVDLRHGFSLVRPTLEKGPVENHQTDTVAKNLLQKGRIPTT